MLRQKKEEWSNRYFESARVSHCGVVARAPSSEPESLKARSLRKWTKSCNWPLRLDLCTAHSKGFILLSAWCFFNKMFSIRLVLPLSASLSFSVKRRGVTFTVPPQTVEVVSGSHPVCRDFQARSPPQRSNGVERVGVPTRLDRRNLSDFLKEARVTNEARNDTRRQEWSGSEF